MTLEWKDVTSRSRGESRDSEPRTVEARAGWAKVVVTRHIHNPGVWHLSCAVAGLDLHPLAADSLPEAKNEALGIVRARLREVSAALPAVTLREYKAKHGLTQQQLADLLSEARGEPVTRSRVVQLVPPGVNVTALVMDYVQRATKGEVTPADWVRDWCEVHAQESEG